MKYVSYVAFCAILLCCPVVRSQSILTLSADDVKFLSGCGVLQDDIKVIPKLPSKGQRRILLVLRFNGRECDDLMEFKVTRDFLRKYTPPPEHVPMPPDGYDAYFLTSAELTYINKMNQDFMDKVVKSFQY